MLGINVLSKSLVFAALAGLAITARSYGSPWQNQTEVTRVLMALTVPPSSPFCLKLTLSGSTSGTQLLGLPRGVPSVEVNLGYIPAGSLTVTPLGYFADCSSVTSSSVPTWAGPPVTVTVLSGGPTVIPLALQPYKTSTTVNFVPFIKSVTVGAESSYALLADGTVRAWGNNSQGQLGDGSTTNRLKPVAVANLSGIGDLAVGGMAYHMCAIKTGGAALCWGGNPYGTLGNGQIDSSPTPVSVSGGYAFKQIAVTESYSCGALTDGKLTCWGDNSHGAFGNGTTTSSGTPVVITTVPASHVEEIRIGLRTSCFRRGRYELVCAGSNTNGEIGNGTTTNETRWRSSTLRTSSALSAGLALGAYHTCSVVQVDGTVRCVGGNAAGQLGDGTTTSRSTATPVAGLTGATMIASGAFFACALKSDGTVWCWGNNSYGQLGDRTQDARLTPVAVYGLSQVIGISAGLGHACAAKSDGTVWCWGDNLSGQLGDGTTTSRAQPVQVAF
jgi:alpha-tubulin suppressor-like RCC1 family protein